MITQLSGLFRTPSVLKATLQAVRQREELLRKNYDKDCEMLQAQLDELKKHALENEVDFDEVKKAASLLADAKKKRQLLKDQIPEDEIVAA